MQKAGFNLNTSQTTHEANDHGRHASIVKEERTSFAKEISVFRSESFDGGKVPFEMRHPFLYFVGSHFRIFVHKFLVHLRTVYASPQKLARLQC